MKKMQSRSAISEIDVQKRQSLKCAAALFTSSLLATTPALASTASMLQDYIEGITDSPAIPAADIQATLVSVPDYDTDSLILRNMTGNDITIELFHANKLVFDGQIVDCNDALAGGSITVPAGCGKLVQFGAQAANHRNSVPGEYLDVGAFMVQLGEGTRVIPLQVIMQGKEAILSEAINAIAV